MSLVVRFIMLLLLVVTLISLPNHIFATVSNGTLQPSPSVLYVWSGQDPSVENAADFVAVVDFDEKSPTYGHILKTVPLTGDVGAKVKQVGNEPHHAGISLDGKYYVTGGLLSFLSGDKEVFVWQIPENPADGPKFLYALDVPGGCTDEFKAVNKSQFIVSMMCNEKGESPGEMAFFDAKTGFTKSYLKNASGLTDFNPHGFDRLENGSVFAADYIQPVTLVGNDSSKILFRNTARHFLPDGSLEKTFEFEFTNEPGNFSGVGSGIGFMELKCFANDPLGRCYVCGTSLNNIYLIAPGMTEGKLVYDLSSINGYRKRLSAGLVTMMPDTKQMLMSFQMRYVVLMNVSDPANPSVQHFFDFCTDKSVENVTVKIHGENDTTTFSKFCAANNNVSGTHWIIHPKGENRFVVVNYFLKFGMAQFEGTRTIHAFKFNKEITKFDFDDKFNPNFDPLDENRPTFYSLNSYPHHAQYFPLPQESKCD